MKAASDAVGRHLRDWFSGHQMFAIDPTAAAADRAPGLQVVEILPGPRLDLVTYVTLGCWDAVGAGGSGTEFVLTTGTRDAAHIDSISRAAAQHCGTPQARLDRGSVVPLERAWLAGSACDRLLVTLPYPYGPEFEFCRWGRNTARLLWLLPITAGEQIFVADHGVEAFESRLEALGCSFTDPVRPSVA